MKNSKGACFNDYDQVSVIASTIAGITGVSVEDQKSKTRKKEVVNARQLTMYFASLHTLSSLNFIGLFLGNRDHSTVIHGRETIKNLIDTHTPFRKVFAGIDAQVKAKLGIKVGSNPEEMNYNIDTYQNVINQL
jgi:chromosomal replication initiation ATPase DnaA